MTWPKTWPVHAGWGACTQAVVIFCMATERFSFSPIALTLVCGETRLQRPGVKKKRSSSKNRVPRHCKKPDFIISGNPASLRCRISGVFSVKWANVRTHCRRIAICVHSLLKKWGRHLACQIPKAENPIVCRQWQAGSLPHFCVHVVPHLSFSMLCHWTWELTALRRRNKSGSDDSLFLQRYVGLLKYWANDECRPCFGFKKERMSKEFPNVE